MRLGEIIPPQLDQTSCLCLQRAQIFKELSMVLTEDCSITLEASASSSLLSEIVASAAMPSRRWPEHVATTLPVGCTMALVTASASLSVRISSGLRCIVISQAYLVEQPTQGSFPELLRFGTDSTRPSRDHQFLLPRSRGFLHRWRRCRLPASGWSLLSCLQASQGADLFYECRRSGLHDSSFQPHTDNAHMDSSAAELCLILQYVLQHPYPRQKRLQPVLATRPTRTNSHDV